MTKPEQSIKKALKWMQLNIDYFNPIEDIESMMPNKVFIELHLMFFIAYRNKDIVPKDCMSIIEEINRHTEKILLNPRYYEQLLLKPQNFRINGFAMIFYLTYCSNPILEETLKRVYPTYSNISSELIPYRKMDLEYCLQLADRYLGRNEYEKKDLSKIAKDSILNTNFDLLNYTYDEEYAITHSLFYLSDFGEKTIEEENIRQISHYLLTMCFNSILTEDMDILGEYIMNICNLNINSEICSIAFSELLKSQQEDGSFPGPNRKGFENLGKPDKNKNMSQLNKEYFMRNYHTTLVAVMASIFYMKYKRKNNE